MRGSLTFGDFGRYVTMPKMKTHKGLKKRVRVTARGKIKHKSSNSGHLMSPKSGNRCRKLRRPALLQGAVAKKIRIALGK